MGKVAKATIVLMIVTMLSKILGFGRELVLTYSYGASSIADAYITSISIPTVLFASISGALATIFIPLFYEVDSKNGKYESLKYINNIFNILIVIGLILAMLSYIFAEPLVKVFAINFTGDKLSLTVNFTRIMIFGIIFIGLSNIMTSWLQINGEFTIPGMIGFPYNVLIIIGIVLSSKGNINLMAVGTLVGMISQFLFQLPFAIKHGFKYKLYININDVYIKKMLYMIVPVFIGIGVNQINAIIDRSLASTLGDGIITVLNSASRLNGFVLGLFIATIVAVIYPKLSKLSNNDNNRLFIETVLHSINSVIILIIPISIGAIVLSKPIVKLVFERGAFDSVATNRTAMALACYSIGMIGFSLREILSKVFYSLKDTKTPMTNGALAMLMNIILNFIFIKFLGYAGLAIATSFSALICIVLLFRSLKKKIGYFGQNKIIKTLAKSLISAVVMGGITLKSYEFLANILGLGFIKEAITLGVAIGIGALVYVLLIILFKVEEINIAIDMFKKRLKRAKEHQLE